MISQAVVIRPLASDLYEAGTEHPGFMPGEGKCSHTAHDFYSRADVDNSEILNQNKRLRCTVSGKVFEQGAQKLFLLHLLLFFVSKRLIYRTAMDVWPNGQRRGGRASLDVSVQGLLDSVRLEEYSRSTGYNSLFTPSKVGTMVESCDAIEKTWQIVDGTGASTDILGVRLTRIRQNTPWMSLPGSCVGG